MAESEIGVGWDLRSTDAYVDLPGRGEGKTYVFLLSRSHHSIHHSLAN
jgi:hypothetical protein